MDPTTYIEDLPDNVLVEILSYLGLNDLVLSARHVCTRWKEASEDVLLWRNRVYTPSHLDSEIAMLLQQTPKLHSLVLNERGVGSVVLKAIVDNCPHLRNVTFCTTQKLSAKFLNNLAAMCPNIEFIHVPLHICAVESKMKAIGQFLNLKEISFGECSEERVALKPIADGCPHLQKIDLYQKWFSYDDFAYFIEKKKDQLESLIISWRSSDYKCLITPLASCTKLKRLVVCEYRDTNLEAALNALSCLHSLTSLTLYEFDDADIRYLINVFQEYHLHQLEELYMDWYDNYEDRLSEIIFKNCPKLKHLYLRYMNLSDSLTNIHLLRDLETVDLRGSKVGEDSVKSLAKCVNIKSLCLAQCSRLSETSMMLMVEFTNLQFLNLEGTNVKGLPFSLFPSRLPYLQHLNVNDCRNVDREALAQLMKEKPHILIQDREPYTDYDTSEDENEENVLADDANAAAMVQLII